VCCGVHSPPIRRSILELFATSGGISPQPGSRIQDLRHFTAWRLIPIKAAAQFEWRGFILKSHGSILSPWVDYRRLACLRRSLLGQGRKRCPVVFEKQMWLPRGPSPRVMSSAPAAGDILPPHETRWKGRPRWADIFQMHKGKYACPHLFFKRAGPHLARLWNSSIFCPRESQAFSRTPDQ